MSLFLLEEMHCFLMRVVEARSGQVIGMQAKGGNEWFDWSARHAGLEWFRLFLVGHPMFSSELKLNHFRGWNVTFVYFSGRIIMMHFVNAEVFLLVYDLRIELLTITIDNDGPLACYDSKLWKGNYRYWARESPLPLSETFVYSHGGIGRKLEPSSSLCWSLFKKSEWLLVACAEGLGTWWRGWWWWWSCGCSWSWSC